MGSGKDAGSALTFFCKSPVLSPSGLSPSNFCCHEQRRTASCGLCGLPKQNAKHYYGTSGYPAAAWNFKYHRPVTSHAEALGWPWEKTLQRDVRAPHSAVHMDLHSSGHIQIPSALTERPVAQQLLLPRAKKHCKLRPMRPAKAKCEALLRNLRLPSSCLELQISQARDIPFHYSIHAH